MPVRRGGDSQVYADQPLRPGGKATLIKDVLDVLIKIYRPNSNLLFPNGGKLTPYLEKLNVGDKIHM